MEIMTEEYEQEEYTCVVRKLMLSWKCGDETQHLKLTRCTVQGSSCDLIIDSGSQENIISKYVVERLFCFRCTMQGSLCDLIINSGSQENIISKDVV